MSTFLPISAAKLNKPLRKHALLPLATVAAVCLCVPSGGASVARTAVGSLPLVAGGQSSSVTTTAIGRNRVPTRGHGGGHGGGHSGGHSSGHSRSGSSHHNSGRRHSSSGHVGSSYSSYSDDDDYKKDKNLKIALFALAGLSLYSLFRQLKPKQSKV